MHRPTRISAAAVMLGFGIAAALPPAAAEAHPSEPGVVSYAVLGKGSVGNIVGAPMRWESVFTQPFQAYWVDLPACNNWADIGLPEVYNDPDLASFNGATTQTSATDQTHYVKQAVGVFATNDAADRAFHRVVDRTVGCSGQTAAMHLDDGTTQVWSFAKMWSCRPRSASLATPVPRSTCWRGRCKTHWVSSERECVGAVRKMKWRRLSLR